MKRIVLAIAVTLLSLAAFASPAHADRGYYRGGRDGGFFLGLGLGAACCGYYPYYSPYYSGYPAYYYAPPTVVYTTPPPVTYVAPPPTVYAPPASAPYVPPATAPVAASQASETFTDDKGRTCRTFQTSISGAVVNGTACLQPDGTWRTVGE